MLETVLEIRVDDVE